MPPRTLPNAPRILPAVPQRPPAVKPATAPRSTQVLQSGRAPQQLSLFLRPSGAR